MPIFEYKCNACGAVQEALISGGDDRPVCKCGSRDMKKLISSFAVSDGAPVADSGCADGSCGIRQPSCSSGLCGL